MAIDAVKEMLDHGARYPEDAAPEFKEKLASLHCVTPDHINLGSGSSGCLDMIITSLVGPRGEMIITQHGFGLYRVLGMAISANIVVVDDNAFHQDLDGILAAITNNTRAVFITNPNNPTGTWLTDSAVGAFIKAVPPHVSIIVDEAYNDYMQMDEYASADQYIANHPNVIVVRTFSKAYGLAGFRIGYSVAHPDTTDLLNRARKPFNVSSIALAAANAALDDTAHMQQTVACNNEGMALLSAAFDKRGLPMLAQSANFLTVEFGEQAFELAADLLKKGIVVRPLKPYKMLNHLRITVGTQEENEALLNNI